MDLPSQHMLIKIFEQSNGSLILRANRPYYTVVGISDVALERSHTKRADIIGKNVFDVFKVNDSDPNDLVLKARNILEQIMETGETVEVIHPYFSLDIPDVAKQQQMFLFTKVMPVFNEAGTIELIVTYSTDITGEISAREKSIEAEKKLLDIIYQAPIAIGVCYGKDLVLETVNYRMLELMGKPGKVEGKPLAKIVPEIKELGFLRQLQDVYTTGIPYYGDEIKIRITRNNEQQDGYFNMVYYPIRDLLKRVTRVLIIAIDVTNEVNFKRERQENEDRLMMAAEISGFGSYDLNLIDRTIIYSARHAAIFGHDTNAQLGADAFSKAIHPDDYKNIVVPTYQKAFKSGGFEFQTRIIWPDESVHWIRAQGRLIKENNVVTRVIGTTIDVTKIKLEETRKNDFIAMVSHELRTPLTSIKAYIELVIDLCGKDHPAFLPLLERAEVQTDKMTSLIQGFLDIAQLEEGSLRLNIEPFELDKLIEEIVSEVSYATQRTNIETYLLQKVKVYADRERIGQVITNLLSNAVKYSPPESPIKIGYRISGNKVKIFVSDKGIGITRVEKDRLFNRFYRVENRRTKSVTGFGIGLYLASQIVRGHNSKIDVRSVYGKGSTFCFSLPIVK